MAKVIAKNRRVFFDYKILERIEAGLILQGWEIKSIRENKVSLKGAFCSFKNNELFVSNMHISQYMNLPNSDFTRPRKLLLHKKQLLKLKEQVLTKGFSILPITLLLSKKGFAKLEIGLGKGKRIVDKRKTISERENKIRLAKVLKKHS